MRITRHRALVFITAVALSAARPAAAGPVRVNPTGVNVSTVGATTVFLTFGGLASQRPAEAFWCGALIPAAPAVGQRCDPATVFGQLPVRFDQSTASGSSGFTDIMSIPASVARRAFEDARTGSTSSFFYVRRFVSLIGGPDEFVAVTCRMAGGGARVPFSLTNVQLSFEGKPTVQFVQPGVSPPAITAEVTYTGTGRLRGRWEVIRPGQPVPDERDLLSEAALPIEQRGTPRESTAEREGSLHTVTPGKSIPARGEERVELPVRLIAEVVDYLSLCFEPKVIVVVPPERVRERDGGKIRVGELELSRVRDDVVPGVHRRDASDVARERPFRVLLGPQWTTR